MRHQLNLMAQDSIQLEGNIRLLKITSAVTFIAFLGGVGTIVPAIMLVSLALYLIY
jgi:hypothetical protein